MWCARCQSDVAAEVAADNRRVHCANCGQDLATHGDRKPVLATQEARDLLERWSNDRNVDPYAPLRKATSETATSAASPVAEVTVPSTTTSLSGKTLRVDTASSDPAPPDADSEELKAPSSEKIFRFHTAHALSAPHADLRPIDGPTTVGETNWMAMAGQWLSYAGVLGLAGGAGMVLLGHFRGPESYLATGWVVTMAGQMMLFLGMVTLISTGMEQASESIGRKVDGLGERMARLEEATEELRQLSERSDVDRTQQRANST